VVGQQLTCSQCQAARHALSDIRRSTQKDRGGIPQQDTSVESVLEHVLERGRAGTVLSRQPQQGIEDRRADRQPGLQQNRRRDTSVNHSGSPCSILRAAHLMVDITVSP